MCCTEEESIRTYTASVIGAGWGGRLSLDGLDASDRFRVVAAADPSATAALTKRHHAIRSFRDYGEMLTACPAEVICIATPTPLHVACARAAMALDTTQGLLIEKPLGTDATQAGALLADIENRRLPLVVPHGLFGLDAPNAVIADVADGAIGDLNTIEIQTPVDLLSSGIHWLAFSLAMLPDDPMVRVLASFDTTGRKVNDGVRVESQGICCFETRSGVRVLLQSGEAVTPRSNCMPQSIRRGALFRLVGTKGFIEFHAWARAYWLLNATHPAGALIDHGSAAGGYDNHRWALDQLATQIDSAAPDYTIPRMSLAALRLIEAAYASHHEQRAIALPYDGVGQDRSEPWPVGQPVFNH